MVGIDSVAGPDSDPAVLLVSRSSGIASFGDLGGNRLGLSGGSQVAAALGQQLSRAALQASLQPFADSQAALQALQLGRLDGLVLRQSVAAEAQRQLAILGIDSQLLPDPVVADTSPLLLAANQSPLRDVLQASTAAISQARALGLQRRQVDDAFGRVLAGTAGTELRRLFDPVGDPNRSSALSSDAIRRLLLVALD